VLEEENQGLAAAFSTSACPSDSVDIVLRIIWGVVLDDPVNFGEVEATLCHIRAQQNAFISLAKFEVGRRPLLLLLLPMNVFHRHVHIIEQVGIKLHGVAR